MMAPKLTRYLRDGKVGQSTPCIANVNDAVRIGGNFPIGEPFGNLTGRNLPILFEEAIFSKIGVDDAYPVQSSGCGRMPSTGSRLTRTLFQEVVVYVGPKAYQGIKKYLSFLE